MSGTPLGVDHLTALDLDPAAFVRAAAAAGFVSVSLRTIHVAGGEPAWAAAPLDAAALGRLAADLGVAVHAIEAVAIGPGSPADPAGLDHALDDGAELGAAWCYAFVDDDDVPRRRDAIAAIAERCAARGMRLLVEAMPYRGVRTSLEAARDTADAPAAGVLVDTLHASRTGETASTIATLADRVPVLQLCDAPAAPPAASPDPALHPYQYEARHARRLPGDGGLPLADFVAALPDALVTVEAPTAGGDHVARLRAARLAALGVLRGRAA